MNRLKRSVVAGLLGGALAGLFAASASREHSTRTSSGEVHEGVAANGDYVELQAYSAGQNFVANKHIVTYDAGGGLLDYCDDSATSPTARTRRPSSIAQDASRAAPTSSSGAT